MFRIKATDSFNVVHWLVMNERRDNWHWGRPADASILTRVEAEKLIREINTRNAYLDSEDRVTPELVKAD